MFDVLTIAAVADELTETLLDGRVQRIGLVDPRTVAAEVYAGGRRRALVASADDRHARLHLAADLPSLDADLITPFGLLLRKYVRGGLVVGIEQPPLERLIRLSIAKRLGVGHGRRGGEPEAAVAEPEGASPPEDEEEGDGEGDATYVHLAVEIMGRHSNLILVDDEGRIMESAKRVTPAMSRVRPILPRLPYTPPPPVAKADPRRLTTAETARWLAAADPARPLWRALVAWLRGISPEMAREIAFRVTGDPEAATGIPADEVAAAIARETRALLEPLITSAWSPRIYRERDGDAAGDEAGPVVAFAPVPMAHLAAQLVEEAAPSISEAAALAEGEDGPAAPGRHAQRRERLLAAIAGERGRQDRRLAAVAGQAARAAEGERWRRWGELIFAYLWQIRPGQTTLDIDGEVVPLDPALGAKETAQRYFERYRKAQGAAEHLPGLQAEIETERAYLDQLRTLTEQAAGFAELEALAAEWEARDGAPRRQPPARRQPPKRPQPLLDAEGNAVFVGHTGVQNDVVTFELVGPDDTWLHARGVAGSHVVVRWARPGGEERSETVLAAARLAAYYSAARGSGSVEVDATRRRHVRKIKGGRPGLVTYRHERTLAVRPADEAGVAAVLRPR